MPPLRPLPPRTPFPAVPPPRQFNRAGLYLAFAIVAATVPFTLKFQHSRVAERHDKQGWQFSLRNITATEAIKRYGPPTSQRDYSLSEGSFAGPNMGLKHFYRMTSPDYAERTKLPVVWSFPEFSMIREMTWKLPDSTLMIWLHEPRSEITLDSDDPQIIMPSTPEGEWVALDNYRVGNDLPTVKPGSK